MLCLSITKFNCSTHHERSACNISYRFVGCRCACASCAAEGLRPGRPLLRRGRRSLSVVIEYNLFST